MFACLPTQDGAAAAAELRRAVGELGAVGALINGYTNVTDINTARYLDDDAYEPMWAAVEELGVPVYLHPREPLPAQQAIYGGYESLVGSAWGFAHETATHAVRLMLSGLFDRHPGVQVTLLSTPVSLRAVTSPPRLPMKRSMSSASSRSRAAAR